MTREERYVELTIHGLAIDAKSKSPILLLRDSLSRLVLPIWIGSFEAKAIVSWLEGRKSERPMTHDLLVSVIQDLGARLECVEIYRLEAGTFLARLRLSTVNDGLVFVECRPSDGIAAALRCSVPIRVEADVLSAAQPLGKEGEEAPSSIEFVADDDAEGRARLLEKLVDMQPGDFGDFEM